MVTSKKALFINNAYKDGEFFLIQGRWASSAPNSVIIMVMLMTEMKSKKLVANFTSNIEAIKIFKRLNTAPTIAAVTYGRGFARPPAYPAKP